MAIVPFHIVDVFSAKPFGGNPAAIIPNAASLTEVEMMQITDELSMEAGFVLPPESPDADLRLRFFTRRSEAAISCHVALGAMVSLVDRGFYRATPEGTTIRLDTAVGVLPVVLTRRPTGGTSYLITLPGPRFGEPIPAGELAEALRIEPEMLQLSGHGPQRVSCGFDQIVVPVSERLAMRGAVNPGDPICELADRRGVGGVTLVCPNTDDPDVDYHCRFFCADRVGSEEVASGTSLGAVAAYLAANGLAPGTERASVVTEQGHARGRPTRVRLFADLEDGTVQRVQLETTGVVVMRGSFHFEHKSLIAGG